MNIGSAARRAARFAADRGTAERAAAAASAAAAGTSFGPGLLPQTTLDQALATGIMAATQHGLVMTSQSACSGMARRIVPGDGTPSGRVPNLAVQAAVSGHDYRADLARVFSEAYRLLVSDTELVEHALRRREAACARWCLVAEQFRRAQEAVQRQTRSWGWAGKRPPAVP